MEMYITKVGMCDESGDVTKVGTGIRQTCPARLLLKVDFWAYGKRPLSEVQGFLRVCIFLL